ncbi:MAG: ATP synthase F0 subunit B [bacterium]
MDAFGINPITIIIYIILIAVLYVILDKFLLSGVIKNMDKRREEIEKNAKTSKELEERMIKLEEEIKLKFDETKSQTDEILEKAKKSGLTEREKIILNANSESKQIVDGAMKRLEQERADLEANMKNEIEKSVKVAVEKLWDEKVEKLDSKIIDKAISRIE